VRRNPNGSVWDYDPLGHRRSVAALDEQFDRRWVATGSIAPGFPQRRAIAATTHG
jgi:hypothetical protein